MKRRKLSTLPVRANEVSNEGMIGMAPRRHEPFEPVTLGHSFHL
jgi:hypothetical protein